MNKEYSSGAPDSQQEAEGNALPSHVVGSGALDRLVETARDYARRACHTNGSLT